MNLQIEAGKYYRTRDGRKVGPMQHRPDRLNPDRAWCNGIGTGMCWSHDGTANEEATVAADIIAEWRDDQATTDAASAANSATTSPPAHIVTHEGREYDLTALETPFGILIEKAPKVAEALQSWPHGVQVFANHDGTYQWKEANFGWRGALAHRAKPAPENPWFVPQDGVMYDRVEVKTIGGVLHIREVKP